MLPELFAKGNARTVEKLKILRKKALSEKAPRVALRIQGILLSLDKHSTGEIARLLHVHRTTVHSWITAWNSFREVGLLEGHRSGRPAGLTQEQKELPNRVLQRPHLQRVSGANSAALVLAARPPALFDPGQCLLP